MVKLNKGKMKGNCWKELMDEGGIRILEKYRFCTFPYISFSLKIKLLCYLSSALDLTSPILGYMH